MPLCKCSHQPFNSAQSLIEQKKLNEQKALNRVPKQHASVVNRRDFLKASTACFSYLGAQATLCSGLMPTTSAIGKTPAIGKIGNGPSPLEITTSSEIATSSLLDEISVHIPLWHQGKLEPDRFWNEVFEDLSAHKINNCFILNYYFVDPVLGNITNSSQFNNNQSPDLSFLAHGMQVARERKIWASLYPVLEIDNPHQIGGIWRGNLNFFGRTLETFFRQYLQLIETILDLSFLNKSPYIFIGSELASLSHNIAARPFWEELIYRIKKTKQNKNNSHHLSLIYAAHWEEYLSFPFWRYMDEIGVNAYFPLSSLTEASKLGAPSRSIIQNNLDIKLNDLSRFSAQHNRPVHLTEFGLAAFNQSVATPWGKSKDTRLDYSEQINGYMALLASLKREKMRHLKTNAPACWLKGASFWHWKLPYRHGSDYNIRPYGKVARLIKDALSN